MVDLIDYINRKITKLLLRYVKFDSNILFVHYSYGLLKCVKESFLRSLRNGILPYITSTYMDKVFNILRTTRFCKFIQ